MSAISERFFLYIATYIFHLKCQNDEITLGIFLMIHVSFKILLTFHSYSWQVVW